MDQEDKDKDNPYVEDGNGGGNKSPILPILVVRGCGVCGEFAMEPSYGSYLNNMMSNLGLGDFEFAYLRVLALFNSEQWAQSQNGVHNTLKKLEELALKQLYENAMESFNFPVHLFSNLKDIRFVSASAIQQVFFRDMSIATSRCMEDVIPYAYAMSISSSELTMLEWIKRQAPKFPNTRFTFKYRSR